MLAHKVVVGSNVTVVESEPISKNFSTPLILTELQQS